MTPPFERTVCSCQNCVSCCKWQPGPCLPGDVERILEHLGGRTGAAGLFVASPGSIAIVNGIAKAFPSITPRAGLTGRCVFLDEQDRCRIHAVAPFGCAYFDTHMSREEGDRRATFGLRAIDGHAEYLALRATLPLANHPAARMRRSG